MGTCQQVGFLCGRYTQRVQGSEKLPSFSWALLAHSHVPPPMQGLHGPHTSPGPGPANTHTQLHLQSRESAQSYRSLWCTCVLVAQLCPTLCNPMDCRPPGSSVCGILQTRILEWAAIPFSRGSSQPKDQTQVSCIAGGFFTI